MNSLMTYLTGIICGTVFGIIPLGESGVINGDGILRADSGFEARFAYEDGEDVIPIV